MQVEKAIDSFNICEFEMDAASIEFRNRSTNTSRFYLGPGYVKQKNYGVFEIKCYSSTDPQSGIDEIFCSPLPGQIYSEEHLYDCLIKDYNGNTWEANSLKIEMSYSVPTNAAAITARSRVICRKIEDKSQSPWKILLTFPNQTFRKWSNLIGLEQLSVGAEGFSFSLDVSFSENLASVKVNSISDLPKNFKNSLIQSLEFVLGCDLSYSVYRESGSNFHYVEFRSFKKDISTEYKFPPISSTRRADAFNLFKCYLNYLVENGNNIGDGWNKLSIYLSQARAASKNSLDAWAVGLTVAVEGISKLIPYNCDTADVDVSSIKDEVGEFLKNKNCPEKLINRITGFIGGMGAVSAKDRMHILVQSGHVSRDDIKAWGDVRNKSVHADRDNNPRFDDEIIQKKLDKLMKVYRLMYSIIFSLIGYRGAFVDYSRQGFPDGEYPFNI